MLQFYKGSGIVAVLLNKYENSCWKTVLPIDVHEMDMPNKLSFRVKGYYTERDIRSKNIGAKTTPMDFARIDSYEYCWKKIAIALDCLGSDSTYTLLIDDKLGYMAVTARNGIVYIRGHKHD